MGHGPDPDPRTDRACRTGAPSAAATGSEVVSLHVFEANEYEATEIRLVKALP